MPLLYAVQNALPIPAVAVPVEVPQAEVGDMERDEAESADGRKNARDRPVMMLGMNGNSVREVLKMRGNNCQQSGNVEESGHIGAVVPYPVPKGDASDDNGDPKKGHIYPDVAKESQPQGAQQTQSNAGQNTMNRTNSACASPNSIPKTLALHSSWYSTLVWHPASMPVTSKHKSQ